MTSLLPDVELAPGLAERGFLAFTTTRGFGSLGTGTGEPVRDVMARWRRIGEHLQADAVPRLATAAQVHGAKVITHGRGWDGWLRCPAGDGHVCPPGAGTAAAVTVADCVPVFVTHPSGAMALLHSGWRGTEAHILDAGVRALEALGCAPRDLAVHLGPAICGRCYEVGPTVYARLTGEHVERPTPVDLRALIADQARTLGIQTISTSRWCTRCDNKRFFSHRMGDTGRQISLMAPRAGAFA